MTPEHREALVEGREQSVIVRSYLDSLSGVARRAHPRTNVRELERLVDDVEADPIKRVEAAARLTALADLDPKKAEVDFIQIAEDYSARKNVSREAWESLGVPAKVLDKANIR